MNVKNIFLITCILLNSIIPSTSQGTWMPRRTGNITIEDSVFNRKILNSHFLELHTNEFENTLNNIAAAYARVYAPADTVFKYLNLSIAHYPHEECSLLFDTVIRKSFVKAVDKLYSKIDETKYKEIKNRCDSISNSYNKELQSLLIAMNNDDQEIREQLDKLYGSKQFDKKNTKAKKQWAIQAKRDSINQIKLDSIYNIYGYPGKSLLGLNLCNVGVDIILHAPLPYQEKYLKVVEEEAALNEIDKQCYPYVIDRILMIKGEKQIYGTQFKYNKNSRKLELYPVEDAINLKARREIYHLPPLKEDIDYFNNMDRRAKL